MVSIMRIPCYILITAKIKELEICLVKNFKVENPQIFLKKLMFYELINLNWCFIDLAETLSGSMKTLKITFYCKKPSPYLLKIKLRV